MSIWLAISIMGITGMLMCIACGLKGVEKKVDEIHKKLFEDEK